MPPTSIFISAASSGMSGIGNSRSSVLLGPIRTAASTFSDTLASLLGLLFSIWPEAIRPSMSFSIKVYKVMDARDKPGQMICHARFHQERPAKQRLDRARTRLDPPALCAHRRRNRHGVGDCLPGAGLSPNRDACGVLDGGRPPSFQDFRAACRGER